MNSCCISWLYSLPEGMAANRIISGNAVARAHNLIGNLDIETIVILITPFGNDPQAQRRHLSYWTTSLSISKECQLYTHTRK